MDKRKQQQSELWGVVTQMPDSPGHLFYRRLNELLAAGCDGVSFDAFVEALCQKSYPNWVARASRRALTSECC